MQKLSHIITFLTLGLTLASACTPSIVLLSAPSPTSRVEMPTAAPTTERPSAPAITARPSPLGNHIGLPLPSPTIMAVPIATTAPTATPTAPSSFPVALPAAPACSQLVCNYATLNLSKILGFTDNNVLKLFSAAADPTRNRVYVSGILTRHIGILDGATEKWIGTLDSGIEGYALKYLYLDAVANLLYIADASHDQLSRIDLNTGARAGPVTLPNAGTHLIMDSRRTRVYLSGPDTPNLSALDGKTLQQVWAFNDLGKNTGALAFDAQSDTLYILDIGAQDRQRAIYRFDLNTAKIVGTINYAAPTGGRSRGLEWDAQGKRFFVIGDRQILVLAANGVELRAIQLPRDRQVQSTLFDTAHNRFVILALAQPKDGEVAGVGGILQAYDADTGRLAAEISFGNKPHRMTFSPANGKIYVPNGDASVVWSIATDTYTRAVPLRLGVSLEQIVATDGGRVLYMNSRLGGSELLALNIETNQLERFASGTWPIPIRADSNGERLFVLNAWDSTLAIYDLKPTRKLAATIPLGLPRGTTDRLPDLAIDTTHQRAYAAYPEFSKIAIVDLQALKPVTTLEVAGFKGGDTGGGPGQMQISVNASANLLYIFWAQEHRLTIYDGNKNYAPAANIDLSKLNWNLMRDGPGSDLMFLDTERNRLFVGAFELDAKTGQPTGRTLARGQQILALDAKSNTYWAVGADKKQDYIAVLDRNTLAAREEKSIGAASNIVPAYYLDLARHRLYVAHMQTATLEVFATK